jgi:hypothetical protein
MRSDSSSLPPLICIMKWNGDVSSNDKPCVQESMVFSKFVAPDIAAALKINLEL